MIEAEAKHQQDEEEGEPSSIVRGEPSSFVRASLWCARRANLYLLFFKGVVVDRCCCFCYFLCFYLSLWPICYFFSSCPPHPPPLFCSRTTSSLYTVPAYAYCVDIMWKRVRSVNFAYCVEDRCPRMRMLCGRQVICCEKPIWPLPICVWPFHPQQIIVLLVNVSSCNYTPSAWLK